MRIAQISPLFESVPPQLYGGTERVVSYLTEALVAQGHHVTLFASGDSVTSANLTSFRDVALRLDPAPLKAAMASLGWMQEELRAPMTPASEEVRQRAAQLAQALP